eukprot:scaffold13728_cov90-Isochrysis_galbana.AAC.1
MLLGRKATGAPAPLRSEKVREKRLSVRSMSPSALRWLCSSPTGPCRCGLVLREKENTRFTTAPPEPAPASTGGEMPPLDRFRPTAPELRVALAALRDHEKVRFTPWTASVVLGLPGLGSVGSPVARPRLASDSCSRDMSPEDDDPEPFLPGGGTIGVKAGAAVLMRMGCLAC